MDPNWTSSNNYESNYWCATNLNASSCVNLPDSNSAAAAAFYHRFNAATGKIPNSTAYNYDPASSALGQGSQNFFYNTANYMKMTPNLDWLGASAASDPAAFVAHNYPNAVAGTSHHHNLSQIPGQAPSEQKQQAFFPWMRLSSAKNGESKRTRQTYTRLQTLELEKEFYSNRYLTRKRRQEISKDLDLTERQIKIWFQNRRMKWKKEGKIGPSDGATGIGSLSAIGDCCDSPPDDASADAPDSTSTGGQTPTPITPVAGIKGSSCDNFSTTAATPIIR